MTKPHLNRRTVLGAGAIAGVGLSATSASTAEPRTWKMVTSWPKGAPGVGTSADRLAAKINQMSGGRLTVTVYGAGELVPPFEVFDAVSSGTAEMGHGASHFWSGKDPAFNYFTGLPFGLTAHERIGWLNFGGGQALWDETYAPFGVRAFFAGSSGVQAGGWFTESIKALDDLQGLKMRIAGLGGEVLRRLGVTVTLIPPGEIFGAMTSGTIDAAEWVGPWNDIAFGLSDVAKHYYLPAFHEPGPALECLVNLEAFAALPEDLQAIVREAASAAALESLGEFTFYNAQAFATLGDLGVSVHTWPEDVIAAMRAASDEVLTDLSNANELCTRINGSYESYRLKAVAYADASEREMLRLRLKNQP
ncbi:MAG: TRAP transporter substrate-binding protein [Rhodobiaceae bacterium]|nr:TRAP transporter substrate-binding protein [Rhodobiaceae bacterium]